MPKYEYKGHQFESDTELNEEQWNQTLAYYDSIGPKKAPTTFLEDTKIGLAGALGSMAKGAGIVGGGIAGLIDRDYGDQVFESTGQMANDLEKWANPDNKEQSFGGKVAGTVASLPVALPGMLLNVAETPRTLLDAGESVSTAAKGLGIDATMTALGLKTAGAVGKNLLTKFGSGAAINAAQDTATRAAIENIAETEKAKKTFEPTLETAALAGIIGGPMGMLSPSGKQSPAKTSDTISEPTNGKHIQDKLLTDHGIRLIKSIESYDEQIKKLSDSGDYSPEVLKVIEDLTAAKEHDSKTLAEVQKALEGKTNTKAIAKEIDRRESERLRREQLPPSKNKRANIDEEVPLSAYDLDLNARRANWDELPTIKPEVDNQLPKLDESDAALRELEQVGEAPLPKIEGLEEPSDIGVIKTGTWVNPDLADIRAKQQEAQLNRMDQNAEVMNREIPGYTLEELRTMGKEPVKYDETLQKEPEFGIKNPDVGFNMAIKNIDSNTKELQKIVDPINGTLAKYNDGRIPSGTLDLGQIQKRVEQLQYHINKWEGIRDFYEQKVGEKTETKDVQLIRAKEETAPRKYSSMEELLLNSADENDPRKSNISKALLDNPQLVNQVKNTQTFFDTRLPRDTQNMVRSLLSLTQMGKERVIVLMDNDLTSAGRAVIEGNTTIIRLNPEKVNQNLQRVEGSKYFNTIPGAKQLRSATRMLNEVRYYAHEIGHAIFYKYLRDSVTHLDDLRAMYSDWSSLYKENKFEVNSLFDTAPNSGKWEGIRKDYQKNFSEYFAERVARQLLHKHVLTKFSKYKAFDDIKKVINASADFLKSRGIDLNKQNFTDDILSDIINGNKDYIKQTSVEAEQRIKLLEDDAAITKAKFNDAEAFPFYKKTMREVHDKIKEWSVDDDPMLNGLGYGQHIFPDKITRVSDDMKDPSHRPVSLKTILYTGGGYVAKNFFGKNYVAKIFKDNPEIQKAYTDIRSAERESSSILSKQWFGDVSKDAWNKAGFFDRMSKVKTDDSAYNILKKATNDDAAAVLDVFEIGFRDELDYKNNLKINGTHLTPEQVKFYNKMAELFSKQYDDSVRVQEKLGKKNILPHRQGWFPAVRKGPYSVSIGFHGDTIHRQNFRSKVEADLFRRKFEKETGGVFDIGDSVYYRDENPITQDMFKTIDMVENIIKQNYGEGVSKPIHDRIEAALQKVIVSGGKLGGHHNYRSNLSGYLGSEIFNSRAERGEAFKQAIQTSVNEYAGGLRNMMITTNTDMMLKQNPDNMVLHEMVTSAKNRTENRFHRVDDFIRNTWDKALLNLTGEIPTGGKRSIDSVYNAGLEFFYLTKLMAKFIFPINQALAFSQAVRQMSVDGGFVRPYTAMGKGIFDLLSNNAELKNQLYEVSTKTNTFEPQFIENLHLTQGNSNIWEGIKKYVFLQKFNESADSLSRVVAFSGAYRMFRDMGMTPNEAQTRAIDVTDQSMVPYGRTEVAPIFNKTGLLGQSMKPLQTFGQAQLGNIVSDLVNLKKTDPKTWAPFVNYALVSTLTAGVVSLVGIQEYEMLRKFLNENWPDYFTLPSVFDIIKQDMSFLDRVVTTDDDTKQALKITAQYGIMANTGVDVMSSSRSNETLFTVIAAVLTGQKNWQEMMPLVNMATKTGQAISTLAGTVVGDKKSAEIRTALTDLLPSGHISYGAKELAGVNTTKIAGSDIPREQVAGGKDNDAVKTRNLFDIFAGIGGTKSTKERAITDLNRMETERDTLFETRKKNLISKYMDTGNVKYIETLGKMGVSSEEIETLVNSKTNKRALGIAERAAIGAESSPNDKRAAEKAKAFSDARLY